MTINTLLSCHQCPSMLFSPATRTLPTHSVHLLIIDWHIDHYLHHSALWAPHFLPLSDVQHFHIPPLTPQSTFVNGHQYSSPMTINTLLSCQQWLCINTLLSCCQDPSCFSAQLSQPCLLTSPSYSGQLLFSFPNHWCLSTMSSV